MYFDPNPSHRILLFSIFYIIVFLISFLSQFCSWRHKAGKFLTWSTWNAQWEKTVFGWSWFRYIFLLFHVLLCFRCIINEGYKDLFKKTFQLQNGGIHLRVIMLIMTKSLMFSGNVHSYLIEVLASSKLCSFKLWWWWLVYLKWRFFR